MPDYIVIADVNINKLTYLYNLPVRLIIYLDCFDWNFFSELIKMQIQFMIYIIASYPDWS